MRIDAGGTEGTSQGKNKRINNITLRLYKSVGVKVGSSEAELDLIPFRSSADDMSEALGMFTGDKEVEFRGCLLYTSPSPRDGLLSRMPSSA